MQGHLRTSLSALSAALLLAACGGGGGGGGESPAPVAPSSVRIDTASRMLTVAWDAVGGATGYNVYVAASPAVAPDTYDDLPDGHWAPSVPFRQVRFEGLEEGGTYWAVVSAIVGGVEGPASAPVSAVLPVGRVRDVATRSDAGSVRVLWAATRGASRYEVFAGGTSEVSPSEFVQRFEASTNTVLVEGLVNGQTYWFAVRAWNENGPGPVSRVVPGVPDGRGTFEGVTAFQAGEGTSDLVLADLDLDGRDEILVANEVAGTVQTFAQGVPGRDPFALVGELALFDAVPSAIGVLDADGDGVPDLAVARREDAVVTVHHGRGDGTFDDVPLWTIAVGTEPVDLVVADVDGNGWDDVLTADRGGAGASLALGQSSVPYMDPVYETREIWDWVAVYDEWGNYIGDEYQYIGSEQVLVGWVEVDPDPFQPTRTICNVGGGAAIATTDFDLDGDLDAVVAVAGAQRLAVLRNDGTGTFQTIDQPPLPCQPDAISVANLSGNGVGDLALSSRDGSCVLILVNDGSGRYRIATELSPAAAPTAAYPADLTGDGLVDLVVGDVLSGDVAVLAGNGFGGYHEHFRMVPCDAVAHVHATDVDADGYMDVVVTDPAKGCVVILFGSSI